jgi:hypothetical protein
MKEEIKHLTEVVLNNPKVSVLAVTITQIEMWWVNWANPLVDAAATIAGFILVLVLINYHAKKNKTYKQAD